MTRLEATAGWRRSALAVALAVVCFAGLGRSLWTPDEPREAEISREMFLRPAVIPTLDGAPFYEKPPLYYWIVAATFALAGGPSIAAARWVSGAAGLLTLLVVYQWGRRAASRSVGLVAALLLATSVTFSSAVHWILLDPLLMLFGAVAAWAAWELLQGGGGRFVALLYGSLGLALWTKGLVGPVLIGAGLLVHVGFERGSRAWRSLRPAAGAAILLAALVALVGALYVEGGREALYQWGWVNHAERFLEHSVKGHAQPFYYYLTVLPLAALPWLTPLVDLFTRRFWIENTASLRTRRYCARLFVAGFAVLSLSTTKRENYLLPLLPPLFLLLSLAVHDRFVRGERGDRSRWDRAGEWGQAVLLALLVLTPGAAAMLYTRRILLSATILLAAALPLAGYILFSTARRRRGRSAAAQALAAMLFVVGGLAVATEALEPEKDFTPFVRELDRTLPAQSPVFAIGADETVLGIVPFLTGRPVLDRAPDGLKSAAEAGRLPGYVLLQRKRGRPAEVPELTDRYDRLLTFGAERELSLWRRRAP